MMFYQNTITQLKEFYPLQTVGDEHGFYSAWFIPENCSLPLTLTWDSNEEHGLTLTLALGKPARDMDQRVLLELMTVNMMMAAVHGPRFSYSRSTEMITLINTLSVAILREQNVYHVKQAIDNIILKGEEVRIHMESNGVKLSSELG